MLLDVREYIDRLHIAGHTVGEDHDDDPVLIDPDGRAVDTWRENYPYDERMPSEEYDEAKYLLQVELLKFQTWAADTDSKHVLLFEGRDAAGKGGTIKRFMEHLNPQTVVIGGDMGAAFDLYSAGVREAVYSRSTARATRELRFTPAAHGDSAGLVGCAAVVIEHELRAPAVDARLRARA